MTPGMGTLVFEGAPPGFAPAVASDFGGTPGADTKAAGLVTVLALGAVLRGAAAAGRVTGGAMVPDLAAESVAVDVAGALGAGGGSAPDTTDAVIECAGTADSNSAKTSNLRFMVTPFIVAAATIHGMSCRVRPSRRSR